MTSLAAVGVIELNPSDQTVRLPLAVLCARLRYAQLLDWLRICLRFGWLKPPRGQRKLRRHEVTWRHTPGGSYLQAVLDRRIADRLEHPRNLNRELDAAYEQARATHTRVSGPPPPRTA